MTTKNLRATLSALALVVIACHDIHAPDASSLYRLEITAPNRGIALKEQVTLQVVAFSYSGFPIEAPDLTWTSSEPSIASVSDGVVTGLGLGYARISATGGGKTAYATVTIRPASLSLSMQPQVISVGDTAVISGTSFDHTGAIISNDDSMLWWEYDDSDAVEFFRTPVLSQRQLGVIGRKPGQLYVSADGGGGVWGHLLITVVDHR